MGNARCRVGSHVLLLAALAALPAAAGVRDQVRVVQRDPNAITQNQATDLTLTLTEAALRPIQSWIRTAGRLDATRRGLSVPLPGGEAAHVKEGQRARLYTVDARMQMHQARVTAVRHAGATIEARLALNDLGREPGTLYITEIVVDRGTFLSAPNVSIIEEQGRHVVYVETTPGHYARREIHTGLQGEMYTEVRDGLKEGDQLVSIGSFFIDADHKLKSGEAQ